MSSLIISTIPRHSQCNYVRMSITPLSPMLKALLFVCKSHMHLFPDLMKLVSLVFTEMAKKDGKFLWPITLWSYLITFILLLQSTSHSIGTEKNSMTRVMCIYRVFTSLVSIFIIRFNDFVASSVFLYTEVSFICRHVYTYLCSAHT